MLTILVGWERNSMNNNLSPSLRAVSNYMIVLKVSFNYYLATFELLYTISMHFVPEPISVILSSIFLLVQSIALKESPLETS